MKSNRRRTKSEPVISLINIVFLILIFFMVAGTLAQPDKDIAFIQTSGLECCSDPNALTISQEGALAFRGEAIETPDDYLRSLANPEAPVRLLPDKNLPARDLLALIDELKGLGARKIIVLTEAQSE